VCGRLFATGQLSDPPPDGDDDGCDQPRDLAGTRLRVLDRQRLKPDRQGGRRHDRRPAAVTLVETSRRTRRVDGGSAMGIVFPVMFALGTVIVSRYFSNVHLDSDAILMDNIEFSVFDRLTVGGG
jgi:hypothetical protein